LLPQQSPLALGTTVTAIVGDGQLIPIGTVAANHAAVLTEPESPETKAALQYWKEHYDALRK
jgi:hypothetical protein